MNKKYFLGLYEKAMPHSLSVREKLEFCKKSGFDFLELSVDETEEKLARLAWSKKERQAVKQASMELGVPIGSICLSGHRKFPLGSLESATRKRSLEIMAQALDLAVDLGVPIIQLAGYDVYYEAGSEETKKFFLENLRLSVEMAAKIGVILAFETMETPFMDTVEKAMYYVKEVNAPYLQVYPDLGNLTNAALIYKKDVLVDLKSGTGHLAALHLKETRPGVYRDLKPGDGHVDFTLGIEKAWDLGVRRFVCEIWDDGNYKAQIDHTYNFVKSILDKM